MPDIYYGEPLLIGPDIVSKNSEICRFCVNRRSHLLWSPLVVTFVGTPLYIHIGYEWAIQQHNY